MQIIERTIRPAPEAFRSPGGWALAVEQNALDERLDQLQDDSPWSFIDDGYVSYDRAAHAVVCSYHVPSVLPIRGSAL